MTVAMLEDGIRAETMVMLATLPKLKVANMRCKNLKLDACFPCLVEECSQCLIHADNNLKLLAGIALPFFLYIARSVLGMDRTAVNGWFETFDLPDGSTPC